MLRAMALAFCRSLPAPVEMSPKANCSAGPAAQADGDVLGELLPGLEGHVLLGQGDGHAAGHAPGDDGDLVDGILGGRSWITMAWPASW